MAAPLPDPTPLTAMDLGHPIRYPLRIDDVWRTTCACHWWAEAQAPEDDK